tara:strand:+ start:825 stop:1130 length:306 start_codon:yes stop_codon:yes gene_type:complete
MELGGKGCSLAHTTDPNLTFFQWLPQGLEDCRFEFWDLIEQKDSPMGECDLTWSKRIATADDGRGRGRVVRRSHGWTNDEPVVVREETCCGADSCDLERVL